MTASRTRLGVRTVLALIAAGGLGVDAYAHFDLAGTYDAVRTSTLSQGDLFRIEGVAAILAGAAAVLRPRRYTALAAFAVAASALAAVVLYRYVNVGSLGPIPSMYEPAWYPEKAQAAWAEAVAAAASAALCLTAHLERHRLRPVSVGDAVANSGSEALQ